MKKPVFLLTSLFVLLIGCSNSSENTLRELKIGNQIWMAKNMDIPTPNSCCPSECDSNGRLYSWHEAVELADQIEGWRIPNEKDWRVLEEYLGSGKNEVSMANRSGGDKLKKIPSFDVFPGICGNDKVEYFGQRASYWGVDTTIYNNTPVALCKMLFNESIYGKSDKIYHSYSPLNIKMSVRLIKE